MADVAQQPHSVLVVEPSPTTSAALAELLGRERFAVEVVQDGVSGIECVLRGQADLVLLNLELPDADALDVLRRIRATPSHRYLPVIILSDRDDRPRRLEGFRQGADDFILHPWDDEELLARVHRMLNLRRRVDDLLLRAAELHHLSITDHLTQVHNHRFFQDRLREEFRRAQRYDDPLSLVLLDIDHFKRVNDAHGHPTGDQVLREVANSIRGAIRDTDILARYGGEEFAVLLPKTHLAGALTVAERVWKGIGTLAAGPGGTIRLTASLGVSGYPTRLVATAEQLVRTSDEALYRAKSEGRNKICLHQQVTFLADPPTRTGSRSDRSGAGSR
ncbi:MAG TPA: diguanylate cyclase [Myxococcaceae bacterium]|nr:diguanylate cyclase [Myxococcaceae bacterium]